MTSCHHVNDIMSFKESLNVGFWSWGYPASLCSQEASITVEENDTIWHVNKYTRKINSNCNGCCEETKTDKGREGNSGQELCFLWRHYWTEEIIWAETKVMRRRHMVFREGGSVPGRGSRLWRSEIGTCVAVWGWQKVDSWCGRDTVKGELCGGQC